MSRIQYNARTQAERTLFTSARYRSGVQAVRQGINFGATWATGLIGPDISLPAGVTNNPPSIGGSVWDGAVVGGRPPVTFTTDANRTWIRGHLVNGEWNGPGNDWQNLVPLTALANGNHATVEGYMRNFCQASLLYDDANYRNNWIGIAYLVQCSTAPWAHAPSNIELYSYAPNFIKVSWRAVTIPKPNLQAAGVQGHLDGLGAFPNAIAAFPAGFNVPARPLAIGGACIPAAGNAAGGAVYAGPAGFPAAQANGFDGDIEVHQS